MTTLPMLNLSVRVIPKPWGCEKIFAETPEYVGKVITIHHGHRLSRQFHNLKTETFLINDGKLHLELGDPVEKTLIMEKGDTFHCPPKTIHRMCAYSGDVEVIEVSTNHLDDVVRLADDYGR